MLQRPLSVCPRRYKTRLCKLGDVYDFADLILGLRPNPPKGPKEVRDLLNAKSVLKALEQLAAKDQEVAAVLDDHGDLLQMISQVSYRYFGHQKDDEAVKKVEEAVKKALGVALRYGPRAKPDQQMCAVFDIEAENTSAEDLSEAILESLSQRLDADLKAADLKAAEGGRDAQQVVCV